MLETSNSTSENQQNKKDSYNMSFSMYNNTAVFINSSISFGSENNAFTEAYKIIEKIAIAVDNTKYNRLFNQIVCSIINLRISNYLEGKQLSEVKLNDHDVNKLISQLEKIKHHIEEEININRVLIRNKPEFADNIINSCKKAIKVLKSKQ